MSLGSPIDGYCERFVPDHHLSRRFLEHFAQGIAQVELSLLRAAWMTQTARTEFYGEILNSTGRAMGMTIERELLVVDFALMDPDDRVPRIFIESENVATSAVQEVRKLCCLAAPLKILLAVCEWDESPGVWPHGSLRPHLIAAWRDEVAHHAAAGSLVGEIIAVVAEWRSDHTLRFYSLDLRNSDSLDALILSRELRAVGT